LKAGMERAREARDEMIRDPFRMPSDGRRREKES
jgi:hypothetical protein